MMKKLVSTRLRADSDAASEYDDKWARTASPRAESTGEASSPAKKGPKETDIAVEADAYKDRWSRRFGYRQQNVDLAVIRDQHRQSGVLDKAFQSVLTSHDPYSTLVAFFLLENAVTGHTENQTYVGKLAQNYITASLTPGDKGYALGPTLLRAVKSLTEALVKNHSENAKLFGGLLVTLAERVSIYGSSILGGRD